MCPPCQELHDEWTRSGHHLTEKMTMLIRHWCKRNCGGKNA